MKYATLQQAINDAKRFIDAASKCKVARDSDGKIVRPLAPFIEPGRESAAAKRASMDLSRTLADMRGGK